nr:YdcF family protein [Lactobacillus selangorensis]
MSTAVNRLGAFCGVRDVPTLTITALQERYGLQQVDVMVLFGGSILAGERVLAEGIRQHLAKKYVIVGGHGHTTAALRKQIQQLYPDLKVAGMSEAELFAAYLKRRDGLQVDLLECESTNCGNNITNLLALLKAHQIEFNSILLCQDATMQRRMAATLAKYAPQVRIINYAAYQVQVNDHLTGYDHQVAGMWPVSQYLTLLMGEIPRLADTPTGYGPRGKGYLAHVAIPAEVTQAFQTLKRHFPDQVRSANPEFATHKND